MNSNSDSPIADSYSSGGHASPTFNVVIAYEDFCAGMNAKYMFDCLVGKFGSYCSFHSSMWKFDFLRSPKLREIAAQEAENADIIVLAAQRENNFPSVVKDWLDLGLPVAKECLLIGMFDSDGTGSCRSSRNFTYLRKISERTNMNLVCLEYDHAFPTQSQNLLKAGLA